MAKRQPVAAPVVETPIMVAPVPEPEPEFLPYAGNEVKFEAILNEAYTKVAYLWIRYHKEADEDADTEEKITDRYVLPMTQMFAGTKNRRYFRGECMHARMEKDLQLEKEIKLGIPREKRFGHKLTTDRCFRLDRVEYFKTTVRPLTDKNRHYAELLNTYPQLRQRLGLKAIWIETTDDAGQPLHARVLVAIA